LVFELHCPSPVLDEAHTASFLMTFARTASWTQAAPLIGDRVVPPRVRVLFAGVVALPLSLVRPEADYSLLIAKLPFEILFGILVGAAARLILTAAEAGGQLIGMQLGLGFAGSYDPLSQDEALPTRRIAYALAAMAFLSAGGLEEAVRTLALPLPQDLTHAPLLALVQTGSDVLYAGVRLAAPLLFAGIVANVTMAFASKAAPALNVFSVMLALFLLVGALVMVATAPLFIRELGTIAALARDAVGRIFG
jgi:flagellar biosynthetic protein FliR